MSTINPKNNPKDNSKIQTMFSDNTVVVVAIIGIVAIVGIVAAFLHSLNMNKVYYSTDQSITGMHQIGYDCITVCEIIWADCDSDAKDTWDDCDAYDEYDSCYEQHCYDPYLPADECIGNTGMRDCLGEDTADCIEDAIDKENDCQDDYNDCKDDCGPVKYKTGLIPMA